MIVQLKIAPKNISGEQEGGGMDTVHLIYCNLNETEGGSLLSNSKYQRAPISNSLPIF